ncbi:MAG: hypothetical protein M0Z41_19705 [Peptococcaceae bacterium]|nr:hypothetical protein [Peptococcaceae bacterium]
MRRIQARVRKDNEGYRAVWRVGRAGDAKKRQRLFGPNRPAT